MQEYNRTHKVADFLKRELAQLIQFELSDPRIGIVSVTDVDVSRDLSNANIYVTVLGIENDKDAATTIQVLNKAAGYLRSLIAKSNHMRLTPKLRFKYDSSVIRGQQMESLIDQVVAEDKQRQEPDLDVDEG